MNTVRVVLFDLFGVIAHHQSLPACERLERVAGASGETFWKAYWAFRPEYDRGDLTAVRYWHEVGHAAGREFSAPELLALVEADVESWSRYDDEMVAYARELKDGGTRLGLLSNIPAELAAFVRERWAWLDLFEALGFSCTIGHVKPEPEAYGWCVDRLGVAPADITFVDDRQENVDGALAIGMRAVHYTTTDALRESLSKG